MHVNRIDGAFEQSIEGCFSGERESARVTNDEFSVWLARADNAVARLKMNYAADKLPLLGVAHGAETLVSEVEQAYRRLSEDAQKIIFFGTGGSTLGGQTLAQFGGWNIPGFTEKGTAEQPTIQFYDNLDPDTMMSLVRQEDLSSQRFVIISKSGGTSETLSQAIVILEAVRMQGFESKIPDLFLCISDPDVAGKTNGLRELCKTFDIPVMDHPSGIGGRFSIFTCVGLLPAVARGLNIRQLLSGAEAAVANILAAETAQDCPAASGAAIAAALYRERTARIQVLMPYADRLAQVGRWYVQLWAESLGKNGLGTTPVACLGPLDQHSQLQLFMDGPNEHYLTFLRTELKGTGPRLPADLCLPAGFDVMAERTIGDLVSAQTFAVPAALCQAGRAVRTIDIAQLNEFALGALLMHFMLETILTADLIGVDPFGQPAVELGKRLTLQWLAQ